MPSKKNKFSPLSAKWGQIVGLTGGIGSGKSFVLREFKKKGARVLDADLIVHQLLDSDMAVLKKIRRLFGDKVFISFPQIDKKYLARVIFSSRVKRLKLEKILHPAVRKEIINELNTDGGQIAVCDIPLLFEKGWYKNFRPIVVVSASREIRIKRLIQRGLDKADILARMKTQWPMKKKEKKSDFVINNNGDKNMTRKQINLIWRNISAWGK